MAGIGFTLKKALGESGRSGRWKVYVSAAFVAAGPWLITLISLFALLWWGRLFGMNNDTRDLFFATVTYAMIGSNLISTTAQFFLTRYLADALYVEAHDRLLSAFTGMSVYTGASSLILTVAIQWSLPLPFAYKMWTAALTVVLTQLGLLMILLSAAKAYRDIARGFLVGLGGLFLAAVLYGLWARATGTLPNGTTVLALFTLGQTLTLAWLGGVTVRDFPGQTPSLYELAPQYGRYPELLWIGLCYALTLWVDNGLYWWSPEHHEIVADSYRLAPAYDLAKFWTFLALVPGFTVFSVSIETDFYQVFRRFYDAIERGDTLAPIHLHEEELRIGTKAALWTMAKVQAFVALLAWVLALQVERTFPDVVGVFQWTIIGSVPHMVWITAFLLLLYFDARKQGLWSAFIGVVALLVCTRVALWYDWSPGSGYLLGAVVAMVISILMLNRQVERLLYFAFYDPNGSRTRTIPPAAMPSVRLSRMGYPLVEELPEEEPRAARKKSQPRWKPGMELPSRKERHGKNSKSGKEEESR